MTYFFERECRTPFSEAYNILEEDTPIGRLDLHLTTNVVHATLCVAESLTMESIGELIETVDDELIDAIGIARNEFIVHVHQGQDVGVYSNHGFGQNGDSEPI